MKHKLIEKVSKQRLAICALTFSIALSLPVAVYAGKMKGGAEVATSCALKNAGKPGAVDACINGGCMALYFSDPAKRRACINNGRQKIKQLNAHKR